MTTQQSEKTWQTGRVVGLVILFTSIFYIPSIRASYFADDWLHHLALDQLPDIFNEQINLFGLIRTTDEVIAFKRFGLAPWWTDLDVRINFWRPIPSITHWLEYQVVGHSSVVAHLLNIAFYSLSVFLVYRLLSRYLTAAIPLVLGVMVYALDDAHALNIVWVANRNESIGGIFVLAGLLSFLRHREEGGKKFGYLTILAYVCALLSKESGLVLPLFILAHIVVFPEKPGQSLVARVRPFLGWLVALGVISLLFLYVYFVVLHHSANTAYYLNPGKNPGLWAENFFRSGFYHAVILATGVPLHVLSATPVRDYPAAAILLGGITVGFWTLVWKWLRDDRPLRFFILTMIVGQVIVTTSFPDPRNLLLPSIGFAYVVARVFEEAWKRFEATKERRYRAVTWTLLGLHLVLAPVLCQVCIFVVASFGDRFRVLSSSLAETVDYEHLPPEKVEVFFLDWHQREVTALYGLYLRRVLPTGISDYKPITLNPNLTYLEKLYQGLGGEKIHYHSLSYATEGADVRVENEHEIVIRPKRGSYFPTVFELLYTTRKGWHVGQTFEPGPYKATIEKMNAEGEVTEVRFTFPEPLSSPQYYFMRWNGQKFVRESLVTVAEQR